MSFFKKLHHLSSGGASVDEFTMQKLLYPSVPSKEALQGIQPSFSSVETASSRPFPRSTLIKELLDVTISALHNIGPYKEKKSEYVGMVMDRSATSLETKISLWGLDLSEIEKILKHAENLGSCGPQNEELYAGIFKGLAEMVFLAYKCFRSVLDAKNLETNDRRKPPIYGWPLFTQDKRLDAELTHAMVLIRETAPLLGFTADGHDIWLEERKGAEDYTILYDDTKKSKASQAVEAAVRTYVEIWFDSISDLLKEVAIVKSGKPRKQGLQSRGTDPPLYEAAYPKRSERKEKS